MLFATTNAVGLTAATVLLLAAAIYQLYREKKEDQ